MVKTDTIFFKLKDSCIIRQHNAFLVEKQRRLDMRKCLFSQRTAYLDQVLSDEALLTKWDIRRWAIGGCTITSPQACSYR